MSLDDWTKVEDMSKTRDEGNINLIKIQKEFVQSVWRSLRIRSI
jgi:hypothetical protein